MKTLLINIPCIICLLVSGWLLYTDSGGWGWFLFAGIITHTTTKDINEKPH